jgi:hypothetical protein
MPPTGSLRFQRRVLPPAHLLREPTSAIRRSPPAQPAARAAQTLLGIAFGLVMAKIS